MISENEPKNAALLYADLKQSALGLCSRLADPLAGTAVLKRTVQRLEHAERLNEIVVLCPSSQHGKISELLMGTSAEVVGLQKPVEVSRHVKRRKWSLSAWRGGLAETLLFDEQNFTVEMIQVLQERNVHLVLSVPSEAVFVDPEIISNMIDHHYRHSEDMRFTFACTAPGLSCCAYRLDLLGELVEHRTAIGSLLAYNPDQPRSDFINHNCTLRTEPRLGFSPFRYIADTRRSFNALERLIGSNGSTLSPDSSACGLVDLMQDHLEQADELPNELEIEINTEPTLRIKGYPHGQLVHQRKQMSLELFEKILGDCSAFDDICLTLGGFGEPLLHPELPAMIETAKNAGIFGINIETDGRCLTGELADALAELPVDTISVMLDANDKELYATLKGEDCFDQVVANIEAFLEKSTKHLGPLVVPHMVKTRATLDQMEDFYHRWLRKGGFAVIRGYNDFAGQIEDRSVMDMSSPNRRTCRRLFHKMTILSEGSVPICDQDYLGKTTIGSAATETVGALWKGDAFEHLRNAHRQGRFDENKLCANCREWHR